MRAAGVVVVLLAACDDSGSQPIDAAPADAPAHTPHAAIVATPMMVDFGSSITNGPTVTVTVWNTGEGPSGALTTQVGGANATELAVRSNTCAGLVLDPAASCAVGLQIVPMSVGSKTSQLSIEASPGGTVIVQVVANVLTDFNGFISATPSLLAFGDHTVGASSTAQTLLVTNNGANNTGTISVQITGAGAGDYTHTTTCTTLAGGASCPINVTFHPTALGMRQALVEVQAAQSNQVSVSLTGTGI